MNYCFACAWQRYEPSFYRGITMEARVGFEPASPLQTRKLYIPRCDKTTKNDGNAEVRYAVGTRAPQRCAS